MNVMRRKLSGARLSLIAIATLAVLAAAALVYGVRTPSHGAAALKGKQASQISCPNPSAAQNSSAEGPNAPMTKAQGAAILAELHTIQSLIQNGRVAPTAGRAAPAIRGVSVPIKSGWHSIGSADAPVTMIEFTDLQCPFCRRFETTTFPELKREYVDTGKVRFISLDLPLAMHQYALSAAEAEECAAQQGKFWQFRDAVLDDQTLPTPNVLLGHVSQLGLHKAEFQKCVEAKGGNAAVQAGQTVAASVGVHGTPGFVVGRAEGGVVRGVVFTGARPLAFFEQRINAVLNQSSRAPGKLSARR